jgi:hypothetical protein
MFFFFLAAAEYDDPKLCQLIVPDNSKKADKKTNFSAYVNDSCKQKNWSFYPGYWFFT